MACSTVGTKELEQFLGRANCIAGLMHVWRPFLGMMWAALYSDPANRPAPHSVWTRQLAVALRWIQRFLHDEPHAMRRFFSVQAYKGNHARVMIVVDASPWAIGAFLVIGGVIREYFHQLVTPEDAKILKCELGSHTAQQSLESFGVLVAMRVWTNAWFNKRVLLTVRSDSVSALTTLFKLRSRGEGSLITARELAADLSKANYLPTFIEHLPGHANTIADVLSRLDAEDKKLPEALHGVTLRVLPPRGRDWWKTLEPP